MADKVKPLSAAIAVAMAGNKVTHLAAAMAAEKDPVAIVECRQVVQRGGIQWVFSVRWNDAHTTEEKVRAALRLWLANKPATTPGAPV